MPLPLLHLLRVHLGERLCLRYGSDFSCHAKSPTVMNTNLFLLYEARLLISDLQL